MVQQNILAAVPSQVPQITTPETTFVGAGTSATIGLLLLIVAFYSTTREPKGLRAKAAAKIDEAVADDAGNSRFDWRSLLYWACGAFGLTGVISSAGSETAECVFWIQEHIIDIGQSDTLPSILKILIAGFLIYMALGNRKGKGGKRSDLFWGIACALFLPMLNDLGAVGSCVIMLLMAMKNEGDCQSDIFWGIGCAIMWPLGGGIWTESILQFAEILSEVMSWG